MLKKYFYIIFTVFFVAISCSQEKEKPSKTQSIQEVEVEECSPSENDGYLGEISYNSIGIVEVGRKMPNLDDYIGYESQTLDQILPQQDDKQITQKVTHLYFNGNEVAYLEFDNENKIEIIVTYNPNYYLNNCLHVGATVKDIKEQYRILDVMQNYDDGMVYIQPVDEPTVKFIVTPDNIIDKNKINEIDGKTSIDNINSRGLIMSIMVSK